jgi:hypothetical protein
MFGIKSRISSKEVSGYISLTVPLTGTERFNHRNCPAGEDTRRRLYLSPSNTNADVVLAHCFNCGGSGSYRYSNRPSLEKYYKQQARYAEHHKNVDPRLECVHEFPPEAEAYLKSYNIDCGVSETSGRMNIMYDEELERIAYILENPLTKEWVSVAYRDVNPFTKQRYLLTHNLESDIKTCHIQVKGDIPQYPSRIVITEDYLSAALVSLIGLHMYPKVFGMPLMGTNISTDCLTKVVMGYDPTQVVVWLDNDGFVIDQKAREIVSRLEMLGVPRVVHYRGKEEPKHAAAVSLQCIRDRVDSLFIKDGEI